MRKSWPAESWIKNAARKRQKVQLYDSQLQISDNFNFVAKFPPKFYARSLVLLEENFPTGQNLRGGSSYTFTSGVIFKNRIWTFTLATLSSTIGETGLQPHSEWGFYVPAQHSLGHFEDGLSRQNARRHNNETKSLTFTQSLTFMRHKT